MFFRYEVWIAVSGAKIISLLSHKATWALIGPKLIVMYGTRRTPYGGLMGNDLMEHIVTILNEQLMPPNEYCLCTFQERGMGISALYYGCWQQNQLR